MKSLLAPLALSVALGCSSPKPPIAELPPPVVSVAKPITGQSVRDHEEFLATLDAAESIEVRARVTGYLTEITFKPGDLVTVGKELFVIDRRPFEAAVKKADGELKISVAELKLAKTDLERINVALKASSGSVSAADRDKAVAQVEVSQSRIDALNAALDQARINFDFTIIKAEVEGIVGRNLITKGNLVTADNTILTTIVKPDPVFAYFDVDQRSVERYKKENPPSAGDPNKGAEIPVQLGLESDGRAFPYKGKVNFADNRLNPNTGSLQVRGVFERKDLYQPATAAGELAGGAIWLQLRQMDQRSLEAGFTARLRVAVGPSFKPVLIPDRAIGTDQGQKYVYVVGADKKIEYRKVTLGNLYTLPINGVETSLRAITSGLEGNEWIVINGLQRVRQGAVVEPEEVDPISERPTALKKKK